MGAEEDSLGDETLSISTNAPPALVVSIVGGDSGEFDGSCVCGGTVKKGEVVGRDVSIEASVVGGNTGKCDGASVCCGTVTKGEVVG